MPFLFHAKNVASVKKKPNIIFIMVDTLRADHLRCYGYSRNTSPNIDQFAKEGMRFERAIAQAPWTSASVSSFMSSRYLRIRYKYGPQGIPDDVVLLPQALRDNGYTTAASISNPLAGRMAGLDRGYDLFYQANEDISNYSKRSEGVLSSAAKQLDKIGNGRFFLFVLFMDPHGPYMWRENHQFDPEYKGKLGKQPFLADGSMSAEDHRYVVSLYDSGIAAADDYVGELIGYLKKKKLYDDTLIVFLSDHGEELNEHDVWGHGLHLYDESISVPFIVKMPEQKQGQVVKGTFSLIDLFPSVMDYIGCDVKSYGLQGTSVPFSGLKHMRETEIYSSTLFKDVNSESLRSSTRKYIKEIDRGNLEQYFDLSNDPLEMHNLALRCRPSDILQQRRSMSQKDEAIDAALASAVSTSHRLSSKDTTALRSLGYLQ
ncbi:MAG TPA: sulfatase [Armatimonadota bacterium]